MEAFLPYMRIPTRYILATNMINRTVDADMVKRDKYAPEGMIGSLTAIRENMTMGVNSGNRETQNALGVSGFFATVSMIKNPIQMRIINGI